ncbi:hypothetical protein NECAME_04411 [Necator americanus]|uniref:Uncharacterized protein n=1 Tax=Necator americanus TaxID=51031 RepID=W2SSU5_NECAM|nr:hypothetical protein NECAME_04411 [Necator americanus]ETN72804.1 hypothetical protein NECAME_04411 [Necator americanus]
MLKVSAKKYFTTSQLKNAGIAFLQKIEMLLSGSEGGVGAAVPCKLLFLRHVPVYIVYHHHHAVFLQRFSPFTVLPM